MKDLIFKTLCTVDKESSRFLNKLKNIINPLNEEIVPMTPPVFTRGYCPFGGTDIAFYLLDEDDPALKNWYGLGPSPHVPTPIPFIQGIKFLNNGLGNITCPLFDTMRPYHELLGKTKHLVIKGANEYGKTTILFEGIIEFNTMLKWEASIGDIIIEVQLDFNILSQKLDIEETECKQDE